MKTRGSSVSYSSDSAAGRDRGAVAVWVALMVVTLLAVAGLVIDGGAMYVERRALQNGADAAALAVAQECGNGNCGDEWAIANRYVDLNADGARANLVCGSDPAGGLTACTEGAPSGADGASGWVRVRSENNVNFDLMPGSRDLTATAVAAWGPLGRARTIPLILGDCRFRNLGGDLIEGVVPSGVVQFQFKQGSGTSDPCAFSRSGMNLPGGFGWLRNDGACSGEYSVGEWVRNLTGNVGIAQGCGGVLPTLVGTEIVLPVFDDARGQGALIEYHVAGFAGFRLDAFRFPGAVRPAGFRCTDPGAWCIQGEFTRVSTDALGFGGTDYGARVIRMIG